MEFWEWITKKYIAWQSEDLEHNKTISDFAAYIGVSQPVMSSWMKRKGKIPRDRNKIARLVARFGTEVYIVLGYAPPQDSLGIAVLYYPDNITSEEAQKAIRDAADYVGSLGLTSSFESHKAFETFLAKRGLKYLTADPLFTLDPEEREAVELLSKLSEDKRQEWLKSLRIHSSEAKPSTGETNK